MSPALVHGRIDSWLLDHEDWIAHGGATRLALCEDWHKVAVEFGAGHPAALGCLVALVREVWRVVSIAGIFVLAWIVATVAWRRIRNRVAADLPRGATRWRRD